MEMNWLVVTIAVAAVAWIVIRRQLKKKEAAPPKEAASEDTPAEEVKEEGLGEETEKASKEKPEN